MTLNLTRSARNNESVDELSHHFEEASSECTSSHATVSFTVSAVTIVL